MKNLMQAIDLFGARSRNRTGTSLRTGDFKSLVVALNFFGVVCPAELRDFWPEAALLNRLLSAKSGPSQQAEISQKRKSWPNL
jgi:hypothetical protein